MDPDGQMDDSFDGEFHGNRNPNFRVGQLLQIMMKHLEIKLVHEAHDVATRTNDSESSPEIGGKHLSNCYVAVFLMNSW